MGRKAAVKPAKPAKRVAQSKQTRDSQRKDFFKKPKGKAAEDSEEEPDEDEDQDYLAFTKGRKGSDDEYDGKKEVFNLNLKDDSDDEVGVGFLAMGMIINWTVCMTQAVDATMSINSHYIDPLITQFT